MTRAECYARVIRRLQTVKEHAIQKGDAVLSDKIRKIELDLSKLVNNEPAASLAEEMDNGTK